MGRVPRTLLITHFGYGKRNGSSSQLAPLVDRYRDSLAWFSCKPPRHGERPPVPFEHSRPVYRPRQRELRNAINLSVWPRVVARRAARFGRQEEVEVIWAALGLEAVVVGRLVAAQLGLPLAVSAMDHPPACVTGDKGFPLPVRKYFEFEFERTISDAVSVGTISEPLSEIYAGRYGVSPVVLYKGVESGSRLAPPSVPAADEALTIASVGSVISPELYRIWADALALVNERGSRRVRGRHIGSLPEELRGEWIEGTGWLSGDDFKNALQSSHAFFLPMYFEESLRLSAETAMPTKLSDYLGASRPIIAFAPPYALATRFVRDYGCGVTCTKLTASALAEAIEALFLDSARYGECVHGVMRAADKFSRDNFFESFEHFLNTAMLSGR